MNRPLFCVAALGLLLAVPRGQPLPLSDAPARLDAAPRGATYRVNDTGDASDGDPTDGRCDTGSAQAGFTDICTLRAAWEQADATPGEDTIRFTLSGARVIKTRGMPEMTSPVVIDGSTPNGNVVLDGSPSPAGASGLLVAGGSSIVENLIIHSFKGSGLLITAGTGTVVRNCWIGIDEAGSYNPNGSAGITVEASSTALLDNYVDGILLFDVSSNRIAGNKVGLLPDGLTPMNKPGDGITLFGGSDNTIGGSGAAERNVVSGFTGNGIAIGFGAEANTVENNVIGTDVSGTVAVANSGDGVHLRGSSLTTIRGNVIAANGTAPSGCTAPVSCDGIDLGEGSTGNVVVGNRVGTDAGGTKDLGNQHFGIRIDQAFRNRIGGSAGADLNVISGNGRSGVFVTGPMAAENVVVANWIGIDAGTTGTSPLPNDEHGILIENAPGTVVAAPLGSAPNVISGNGGSGIVVRGSGTLNTVVAGARIGVDKINLLPIPNGAHGILIDEASNTRVGHPDGGGGNFIAYNRGDGVRVARGEGQTVRHNLIFNNEGLGIDLGGDGVTPNDPLDADRGANTLQNFPFLRTVQGRRIHGFLEAAPTTPYFIDFYSSSAPDPSNHGEGQTPIGQIEVTTDAEGHAPFVFTALIDPEHVTATATDPRGNTSEFSRGPLTLTVNHPGDQPDADLSDLTCDADLSAAGDQCTLRAALEQANANPGRDTVDFALPVLNKRPAIPTIRPNAPLPEISEPLLLDGSSQPGEGWVELDGSNVAADAPGLHLTAGSSTIRGLVINRFASHGLLIQGGGNVIAGNRIGTRADGLAPAPNLGDGIRVLDAPDNLIGGSSLLERNVVSGNAGHGIYLSGNGAEANEVVGNWIGLDASGAGTTEIPNEESGIRIRNAPRTRVGGPIPESRNIISGNDNHGIHVTGTAAAGAVIQGNWIGLDKGNLLPAPNRGHGIRFDNTSDHLVGGPDEGAANTIAFNRRDGLHVRDALSIQIRRNAIFANGRLGIDLGGDGVSFNDDQDADEGPNNTQNFPVFFAQTPDAAGTRLDARLFSRPSTTYVLDFFANTTRDPSGFGEGQRFLATQTVETDTDGRASFSLFVSADVRNVTATATDPRGNTSEFSRGLAALIVNVPSDEPDAAAADGACDTDLDTPGDQCSLRAAIETANADAAEDRLSGAIDRITFDIPGPGVHTIHVDAAAHGPFPVVTDRLEIDATSQPGYAPKTPLIALDGRNAGPLAAGLVLTAGESTVRGLIIHRFSGDGIVLRGRSGYTIQGNFVGTNAAGNRTLPDPAGALDYHNGGAGLRIADAADNLIGGVEPAAANVFSGNREAGLLLEGPAASGNRIIGNLIGCSATGTRILTDGGQPAPTNGIGLLLRGAPDNLIGAAARPNVLAGNASHGLLLEGEAATGNVVTNNRIGLGLDPGTLLPNGGHGILLLNAPQNTVGHVPSGARNHVAANDSAGIALRGALSRDNRLQGNDVGFDPTASEIADRGNGADGVLLDQAPNNTVGGPDPLQRNVLSGNRQAGLRIKGRKATDNRVLGNYVGTDPLGHTALPNGTGLILSAAPANIIGGHEPAHRNLLSGNRFSGIHVSGPDAARNVLIGNYIGTSAAGDQALPNGQHGIFIADAPDNLVGFSTDAVGRPPGNVIAGNAGHGVAILGAATKGTTVAGNSIGVGVAHTDTLANKGDGVRMLDASRISVGGIDPTLANRILFNDGAGVSIDAANPDEAVGNTVLGNALFANGGLGIDLGPLGVNPPFPVPQGVNHSINPPQLIGLERSPDSTIVLGAFISWPHQPLTSFTIEFFANPELACDASGYGEGGRFVGRLQVSTDADGDAPLRFSRPRSDLACSALTATATAPDGSSSEFSACLLNTDGCLTFAHDDRPLELRHQEIDSGRWVLVPDSTTDGNRVRITSRVVNRARIPLQADLRFFDALTGTPLRDSLGVSLLNPSFPPLHTLPVTYRWHTNGFAWNDDGADPADKPQSDRRLRVLLEDTRGVIDSVDQAVAVLPRPVVMVHGLWSNAAVWATYKRFLRQAHPRWRGFAVGDRQSTGRMNTGTFPANDPIGSVVSNTISENAGQLAVYIEDLRQRLSAFHVDIVAHSMGGLISRFYLDELMPPPGDQGPIVRHLAMLATPNLGSPCADDLIIPFEGSRFREFRDGMVVPIVPVNIRQLTTDFVQYQFNPLITNRHAIPFSIAAGNPFVHTCHSLTDGDSVVETTSALAEGVLDMARDELRPIEHTTFPGKGIVFFSWVRALLDQGPGDVPHDGPGHGPPAPTLSLPPPDAAQKGAPPTPQYLGGDEILVPRGETLRLPVEVPEASHFGLTLLASTALTSSLHAPDGSIHDPVEAASPRATTFFRSHLVERPQPGTWTLALRHNDAQHDSLLVAYAAWLHGSSRALALDVAALDQAGTRIPLSQARASGSLPDRLHFLASLTENGRPALGATLTARLHGPSGFHATLPLYDDGAHGDAAPSDGLYASATGVLPAGLFLAAVETGEGAARRIAVRPLDLSDGQAPAVGANLFLRKTVSAETARPGDTVTYTLTFLNRGPETAAAVRLSDPMPPGLVALGLEPASGLCTLTDAALLCELGDVPPGSAASLDLLTSVTHAAPQALVNTASLLSDTFDPNPQNNVSSVTLHVPTATAAETEQEVPARFHLAQNYPNPFRRTTTISYAVSRPSHVHLAVYDLLGRRLAVLVDAYHHPGRYQASLDAAAFSPGAYAYVIRMGEYQAQRLMVRSK